VPSAADRLGVLGVVWAVLLPIWLLNLGAMAWGRVALSRDEVRKGLLWTAAVSVLAALPGAWLVLAYCAGFNPQPKASAIAVGGWFAALLLPAYSACVATAVFELVAGAARTRGAAPRSLPVRLLSGALCAVVLLCALVALGLGCLVAAGPKALG
jgi:hypothetical protein